MEKRYVKFLNDIVSPEGSLIWSENKEYEILNEYENYYQIQSETNYDCGIDKKSEGKKFIIINQ